MTADIICYAFAMIESAHIVFFSGTGCTAYCAEQLKRSLESTDITTEIDELHVSNRGFQTNQCDLLVIMYPVHTFDAPLPIYRYIERLAVGITSRVAVIAVSGGGEMTPNRAARYYVCKALERKGFTVIHESTLVMPCNVIVPTPPEASRALLDKLPGKCDAIVKDITNGVMYRVKPPTFDKLFAKIDVLKGGSHVQKMFAKNILVNEDCGLCGWCVTACPEGNIAIENGAPVFEDECLLCLRCIYGCPNQSLSAGYGSAMVLKDGFSFAPTQKPDRTNGVAEALVSLKGVVWKGVRKYLSS